TLSATESAKLVSYEAVRLAFDGFLNASWPISNDPNIPAIPTRDSLAGLVQQHVAIQDLLKYSKLERAALYSPTILLGILATSLLIAGGLFDNAALTTSGIIMFICLLVVAALNYALVHSKNDVIAEEAASNLIACSRT